MAEIITIATRRVSGTGLILPTSEQLNYRRYYLYADIIRKPLSPYFSGETSPSQTYYGNISLMKDDYVLQTYKIQYDAQIWVFDADLTGQVINTIKCEYEGILQSFVNLGTALGLTVTFVENTIDDWKNLPLEWDSIRIKCFADCAIQLVLKGLEYDVCDPNDKIPRQPPASPEKPTTVPPGQSIDISSAYPGDSTTDPAEIDETYTPPPFGVDCQAYVIKIRYERSDYPGETQETIVGGYGPIGRVSISPDDPGVILLESRGIPAQGACNTFQNWGVFGSSVPLLNASIVSIT